MENTLKLKIAGPKAENIGLIMFLCFNL